MFRLIGDMLRGVPFILRAIGTMIRLRRQAWVFKRKLVESLLKDPDWVPGDDCITRRNITVHFDTGILGILCGPFCAGVSVYVDKVPVWLPIFNGCCVKRAARLRVLQMAEAAYDGHTYV